MAYRDEVLADSPVLYLRLGEASGTNANDETANNLDGTYINTPTLGVAGAVSGNTAVTLTTASSEYITVPDANVLDVGDTFSLECWVKTSTSGTTKYLFSKAEATAFSLRIDSTNKVEFLGGNSLLATSSNTVTNGAWHHVVATKSGSTRKIYVDGVDVTVLGTNATVTNNANILGIGASYTGGFPLNGSLDEVAIFPTALSQTRVQAHYNAATVTGSPPVANFSSSATLLVVQFTDTSTDPDGDAITAWSWNFGTGEGTSTSQNPLHTFGSAGTKSVTLTVTDSTGQTNSVTKSVTVSSNQAPTANFTWTGAALTKTFTDTSTDADGTVASWAWNFGDGGTSTSQNPSHTYTADGTYSVTLTVTDNLGATNSVTKSVTAIQPGAGRSYEARYIPKIETTLSVGMDATQTAAVLAELAYWPAIGEAVVGAEIISWTGKSTPSGVGNLTGVTRGMYGTTASSHAAGTTIGLLGRHDGGLLTRRKVALLPANSSITLQELRRYTDLDRFVWADLNNFREQATLEIAATPTASGNVTTTLDENGFAVPRTTAVSGAREVRSLTINAAPTSPGDVTITLDGVARALAVSAATFEQVQIICTHGDNQSGTEVFQVHYRNTSDVETTTTLSQALSATANQFAATIRAGTYSGWTTSGTGATVVFTRTVAGTATNISGSSYPITITGIGGQATFATTIIQNGSTGLTAIGVADLVRSTSFPGWTTGGTPGTATVTFTAIEPGVKSGTFSYSAGTTGATSTAGLTQTTAGSATTAAAIATAIATTYSANTYWSVSATGSVVTFAATVANIGPRQDGTFSPGSTGTMATMTTTQQGSTDVVVHIKDSELIEQKRRVLANIATTTTFYIETAVSGAGTDKGVVTVWGAFSTDPLTQLWRVTGLDLTDYPLGAMAYGVTYESSVGLTWDVHTDEVEVTDRGKTYYDDHTALGGWINQARYYGRLESFQARNDLFIRPPEDVMMIPVLPGETMTLAAKLRWENIPADVPANPLFVTCHHADGSITQLRDIAGGAGITGTSAWTEPTPYTFTIPGPGNTDYENQTPCYWIEISSRDMSEGTVVVQEIIPSPGSSAKRTYHYATSGSVRATFGLETPRAVPHINVSHKRIALEGQADAPAGTTVSWRYRSAADIDSLDSSGWQTDPGDVTDLGVVEAEATGVSDGLTPFVVRAGYPRAEYRLILANELVSVLLTQTRREFDGGVFVNGYEDWYEDPGASQVILPSGRVRQGELHPAVGQIDEISFAAMRPETVQYLQKNWVKGRFIVERAEEALTVKLKARPNFKRRTRPYISDDPDVAPGRVGYWVSDAIPAEVLGVQEALG